MSKKSIRSRASVALGNVLLKAHTNRIARGDLAAMPLWLWHALPKSIKEWVGRRVLKPGEEFAWQEINSNTALTAVAANTNHGWALSPSSRLFLWNRITEQRPKRLIDLGTGQSTLLFALYAAQMVDSGVDVRVCSVEHDHNWIEQLTRTLRELSLDHYVTFIESPLLPQRLLGREMAAYSFSAEALAAVAGKEGFDLCLIDGPPSGVGRTGSLAVVAPFLARESTILLDDAFRERECDAMAEWRKAWPQELSRPRLLMADGHGMADFKWRSRKN